MTRFVTLERPDGTSIDINPDQVRYLVDGARGDKAEPAMTWIVFSDVSDLTDRRILVLGFRDEVRRALTGETPRRLPLGSGRG